VKSVKLINVQHVMLFTFSYADVEFAICTHIFFGMFWQSVSWDESHEPMLSLLEHWVWWTLPMGPGGEQPERRWWVHRSSGAV